MHWKGIIMKCRINSDNEITDFWKDENAPIDALDCDKSYPVSGRIDFPDQTFFYKLENGKVITTEAGDVYIAQEYARERAITYPNIGDQLDMIYKDMKNSTTTHADAVEAVKTKWPKDNTGPV